MPRVIPRIQIASPTIVKKSSLPDPKGWTAPLLAIKGSTTNTLLENTDYAQYAPSANTLLVTDMHAVHTNFVARNCRFRGLPKQNRLRWGWRGYNLGGEIDTCVFENIGEEHGIYIGIHSDFKISNVLFRNIGSQAMQFSLKADHLPEGSPSWDKVRTLTIRDVVALECGRSTGTRPGFIFTQFKHGPEFTLDVERLYIRTVNQLFVVQNSAGQWCNSTGGMVLCGSKVARVANSYIELNKPEKGIIQAFDYTIDNPPNIAPQTLILESNELIGGPVDVRVDSTPNIKITGCTGNAQLRLWHLVNSKWQMFKQQSIGIPYSQGTV